jgi:hypothetical protein
MYYLFPCFRKLGTTFPIMCLIVRETWIFAISLHTTQRPIVCGLSAAASQRLHLRLEWELKRDEYFWNGECRERIQQRH